MQEFASPHPLALEDTQGQSLPACARASFQFPGRRRSSLETYASSNCLRMGCNITAIAYLIHVYSEVHVIVPPADNCPFVLMEATVCCRFCDRRQTEDERTKIIVLSTYTSVIERSTIAMNGCDCDILMHVT